MKTTLILVCIAVVLILFRFLAIKLTKRLEERELQKAESEPIDSGSMRFKDITECPPPKCPTKDKLYSEQPEEFVVPTPIEDTEELEETNELVMEGVPEDYNDVQNLTPFNHGTYRAKDGRFKSKTT
jgi:hypothetical protein